MQRYLAGAVALVICPVPAMAGLEICNDTGVSQSVSVGYKQGEDWVSEGWWTIAPGACAEPVGGALTNRYYYYRATAAGQDFRGDGYMFCTQGEAYTIVGDTDCAARGYEAADFAVIDTGETAVSYSYRMEAPAAVKESVAKGKSAQGAVAAPAGAQPAAEATVLRSGLGRGVHGEPFTDRLIFQGCDFYDGFEACTFIANGWKYFAGYDDPTPRAFLARLEALPNNTPMQVTGDLTSHGDSTAQLAVSEIEILGADAYSGLRSAMQGNWVSAADPNETLYIQGAEMHSYYKAGYMDTMYLDVKADCPDSAGAGPVLIQTSAQHRDSYCYLIDNLAGGWMDLILMGHEARVSYRKAE
ncbi:MAG: DUF1036 domain-containing protein [Roseovarius sp.]|uniref:DUF1036 domain-containing protein n=1 Tax=Roseovarius sp. TaxID=1486281 RepID=UPI0032EE5E5E